MDRISSRTYGLHMMCRLAARTGIVVSVFAIAGVRSAAAAPPPPAQAGAVIAAVNEALPEPGLGWSVSIGASALALLASRRSGPRR